ncbi:hypothetical protein JYG23_09365 [Sedimentibacter sp. zth1]|uniref:hypothetical protein n=1 Tax=Sedimentibacter sp. zth1 TaxID=2816908 RepID=UPI001A91FE8E|nr:hypothetical protein [Sedimentibacter sp. zth1]QSX04900.1 hypothetical protein JYG23_09365 [Sedimentibacter sp. zth1]
MKNSIIYLLIITFVISFGCLQKYDYTIETNEVEELLSKRIEIINNFLYSEKNLLDLRKQLAKIETDDLLKSDLEILTHIFNNPTEYEKVEGVSINKIESIEVTEDKIEIIAEIEWSFFEGEEISIASNLIKDYNIVCEIKNKNIYLTKLQVVE